MTDYDTGLVKCPYCYAPLTKHGGTQLSKNKSLLDADGKPTIVKDDSWKVCHSCKRF